MEKVKEAFLKDSLNYLESLKEGQEPEDIFPIPHFETEWRKANPIDYCISLFGPWAHWLKNESGVIIGFAFDPVETYGIHIPYDIDTRQLF